MKKILAILFVGAILTFAASAQTPPKARKTVTNSDLEKFRRERIKTDPEDETERRRLGLPSRAEQEAERKRREQEYSEFAVKARQQQAQAENFWQQQAFDLRMEIAAVEAEINYVRARVSQIPPPQVYYAVGYSPYHYNPNYYGGYGVGRTSVRTTQIAGNIGFGKKPHVSIGINHSQTSIRGINTDVFLPGRTRPRQTFGGIPYQRGILTVPFTFPSTQNLTREELLARLRSLEQTRAGLLARFSVLEDEAHRNGVRID